MNLDIARTLAVAAAVLAAACSSIAPDKPVRPSLYDFGPGAATASTNASSAQPAIMLADIEAAGSLESSAMLYRLAYADSNQLRPYAQARWSAPPVQLIRQRLRERLGQDRAVLDASESAALARTGGAMPRLLRVDVEEFSHVFESASQSWGVVRLRATLLDNTAAGERFLAQRTIIERRAAPSPDATGGAKALAAAVDAAADDVRQWLAQQR